MKNIILKKIQWLMDKKRLKYTIMVGIAIIVVGIILCMLPYGYTGPDYHRLKKEAAQAAKKERQEIKAKQEGKQNCFAYWMPHGGMWQDQCYDSRRKCRKALAERVEIGNKVNHSKCYSVKYFYGYCIGNVLTGNTRFDDTDNSEYAETMEVCTRTLSKCQLMRPFLVKNSNPDCIKKLIANAEGEDSFLTSEEKIREIFEKNINNGIKENAKKEIKKETKTDSNKGCTKYSHATSQEQAFVNLGLDWNRTKKWGAFVDTEGVLRANTASCREIVKGSDEYNKYKKK